MTTTGRRASKTELTDNEGSLLALVLRRQPVTAYQLLKIYEQSPVSSFNESKGSLYPLIRRLRTAGLISSKPVPGDARKTEMLSCTSAGRAAVKRWALQIRPAHLLLDDPLRTKVISFDLLDDAERSDWVARAREMVEAKIEEVDAYMATLAIPSQDLVYENAMHGLRGRLEWLDRVEQSLRDDREAAGKRRVG